MNNEGKNMNKEIYAAGEGYILYPLSDIDRDNHVELKRQVNGDNTLFLNPATKDIMWNAAIRRDKDILFSIYEENGEYCGCIELQNFRSTTPEIGIDLLESKRNKGIAAKAVRLLVQKVCAEQSIDYFLIKIMSNNPHSRHVFEKMGAEFIGEEERPFIAMMKEINQSKLKEYISSMADTIKSQMNDTDDNAVVYRYKLLPDSFIKTSCALNTCNKELTSN